MKSRAWDADLLAEHRKHLKSEYGRAGFDELVAGADHLTGLECAPRRQGAVRIFSYLDRASGARPFAFIVNRDDLLFYVRLPGQVRIRGGLPALRSIFPAVTVNPKGEWTVHVGTPDDARRVNQFLRDLEQVGEHSPRGIPDGITREDVLRALGRLDRGVEHHFGESTKYDLAFNGQRYAPKAVVGLAAERLAGGPLGPYDFKGGEESKCFAVLRDLGFEITQKEEPPAVPASWVDPAEVAVLGRPDISATQKQTLIESRRGQGLFRTRVIEREGKCRLTGVADPRHLRASHIKPWAVATDEERLDGDNGLLLSPHLDHLFDRGHISFADNGDLLVSRHLDPEVPKAWGIRPPVNTGVFRAEQRGYLAYHRKQVFEKVKAEEG